MYTHVSTHVHVSATYTRLCVHTCVFVYGQSPDTYPTAGPGEVGRRTERVGGLFPRPGTRPVSVGRVQNRAVTETKRKLRAGGGLCDLIHG